MGKIISGLLALVTLSSTILANAQTASTPSQTTLSFMRERVAVREYKLANGLQALPQTYSAEPLQECRPLSKALTMQNLTVTQWAYYRALRELIAQVKQEKVHQLVAKYLVASNWLR